MDEAAPARTATLAAVNDITPQELQDEITEWVDTVSMTPGILTRLSATATNHTPPATRLDHRTAGVQLIYTGLHLTRTLTRTTPWTTDTSPIDTPDLSVLAADVFVARGFSLLSHTQAASHAVTTVRNFGQTETRRTTNPDLPDHTLETDIYELALIAGTTLTHTDSPPDLRTYAHDLATTQTTPTDTPATLLTPDTIDTLTTLITDHTNTPTPPTEPAPPSTISDS